MPWHVVAPVCRTAWGGRAVKKVWHTAQPLPCPAVLKPDCNFLCPERSAKQARRMKNGQPGNRRARLASCGDHLAHLMHHVMGSVLADMA